ncbi:MAG: glycosyltransferase family 2 protein, partial [Chloroflexi bacterium]|nr:glycosyltransferase family 2 protein [Chloroflexota bacterium]
LMAFLDTHSQVGLVTAKLLNPDGSLQHSAFRFPTLWMSFLDFFPMHYLVVNSRLNGRYPFHYYQQPFSIDHPLGACMMVRREVVETVGPLSEDFFIYCEEIDWCWRIKQNGWLIYCQPEAEIIHYGGQSTAQSRNSMFVELHKSRFLLFDKYYTPYFKAIAKAVVGLGLMKETLKAWSAYHYGELTRSQWQEKLRAYRNIMRLITGHG